MKHKNKKYIIITLIVLLGLLLVWFINYLSTLNFEILNPKGPIAAGEKHLMLVALILSLFVLIPVYGLLIGFSLRYRQSNKKAKYSPNWDKNIFLETSWWVLPAILIGILGYYTWTSSHSLNPYKPITSKNQAVTIDVIALDWRWLFIYPKDQISTMNYLVIPTNHPVNFYITSDGPMNSFWVPQLAGQIYAMAGMSTELHLMAYNSGNYRGLSANLSGIGFSSMSFNVKAVSPKNYLNFISQTKKMSNSLSYNDFLNLAKPKIDPSTMTFNHTNGLIYVKLIDSYMAGKNINNSIKTNSNKAMGM